MGHVVQFLALLEGAGERKEGEKVNGWEGGSSLVGFPAANKLVRSVVCQ